MIYQPSKKTRFFAAMAAVVAFMGTLIGYARASADEPVYMTYRVISVQPRCEDYAPGDLIMVQVQDATQPPPLVILDMGGTNDNVVAMIVPADEEP